MGYKFLVQFINKSNLNMWDIIIIIIIIIIIMSVFLERLSLSNMLDCAEQVQIQKYKTCIEDTQNSKCPNNHAETSN